MRLRAEFSKSARASCKPCGQKIEKGEIRWAKESEVDGNIMNSYTHLNCLNLSKKSREEITESDIVFDGDFTKGQKAEVIKAFHDTANPKPKSTKKRPAEDDDEVVYAEDDVKPSKKKKKQVKKSGVEVTMAEKGKSKADIIRDKYKHLTVGQLKEHLRANKQILTGKKDELVEKCVDGELHGALPNCAKCLKGRLSLNLESNMVECHGYHDEDIGMNLRCGFVAKEVERVPWLDPSEVQHDKSTDVKGAGDTAPVILSKELRNEIHKLFAEKELDPRTAATEMVNFARVQGLALPKDDSEARQKVGSIFMEHSEDGTVDYENAYVALATLFPGGSKAKRADEDVAKAKFEVNGKIADLLAEMASYFAKSGGNGIFKARALKKASLAIRTLDFEVKNGKELSAGKKKIEGVGKATGSMIDEFLTTGKIAELEQMRSEAGL